MKRAEEGDFSVASGASVANALDDLSSRVQNMMDMLPATHMQEHSADQQWAKRVARRVRREKCLEEEVGGLNRTPDRLMQMLCRAEQISMAVHSDLTKMGNNANANAKSLRRIRNSQSLLNRNIYEVINDDPSGNALASQMPPQQSNDSSGLNRLLDEQDALRNRALALESASSSVAAHGRDTFRAYLGSVLNSTDRPIRRRVPGERTAIRSYISNVLGVSRQYEQHLRAKRGVSTQLLRQLPVWTITQEKEANANGEEPEEDCMCPICMDSFKRGDRIMGLCGCSHIYHEGCIKVWFKKSCLCPLCKQDVTVSIQNLQDRSKRSYNPHK